MTVAAHDWKLGCERKSWWSPLARSPSLALTLAAFFWAGSFVVGRALRDDIDPVLLTFLRWLISLMIFAPFVWREFAGRLHVVRREWCLILGLGATGIALFHPLVYIALQHTSAANALLTFSLSPVIILVCDNGLRGTRPTTRETVGILVSMTGAAILIVRGDFNTLASSELNIGDLWMLAAVAVWAIYSLLLRRRPSDLPQTVALVSSIGIALPLLAIASIVLADPTANLTATVLSGIAYIAVFGSVIGFLFWSHGVAELGAARAGQFVHFMPVFGAALAFLFLGEPLTRTQIVGASFVLAGILLIEAKRA